MATGLAYWRDRRHERPYYVYTGLQDNDSWGGPSATRGRGGITEHGLVRHRRRRRLLHRASIRPTPNIVYSESQDGNTSRATTCDTGRDGEHPADRAGPAVVAASRAALRGAAVGADGRLDALATPGATDAGGGGRRRRWRWPRRRTPNVLNAAAGRHVSLQLEHAVHAVAAQPEHRSGLGGNRLFKSYNRGDELGRERRSHQAGRPQHGHGDGRRRATKRSSRRTTASSAYSTIIAISESPVMPGVVWAGTDDGNLQVSRDGGTTFTEVGKNMHRPAAGRAHRRRSVLDLAHRRVALRRRHGVRRRRRPPQRRSQAVRVRHARLRPTFQSIADNLPAYGNVQVVREDPKNKDLLYVGTEFGLFISLDGGKHWEKFMNNYPTVRTDDILIHPRDGDLIVATHGREHLDRRRHHAAAAADRGGRRRRTRRCSTSRPAVAYLIDDRTDNPHVGGQKNFVGENAPRGTAISYYLKSAATGDVKVSIADATGRTLCTSNGAASAGHPSRAVDAGGARLNRAAGAGRGGGGAGGRGGSRNSAGSLL